jgi:GNAT superfamily N-acetyltransferase
MAGFKRIIRSKFCKLPSNTKKRLLGATLPGGYMREFVRVLPESPAIVAFSNKQIVGWSSVFIANGEYMVSTYVNQRYRHKGVGTRLIELMLAIYPNIILCQWNSETKALFSSLREKHGEKIEVRNWWRWVARYQKMVNELSK